MSLETKSLLKAFQLHYCLDNDAKSMVKHLFFLRKFAVLTTLFHYLNGEKSYTKNATFVKWRSWHFHFANENTKFTKTAKRIRCDIVLLPYQTNRQMQWSREFSDNQLYRVSQVSCNIKNQHISASKSSNQFLKKIYEDLGLHFLSHQTSTLNIG